MASETFFLPEVIDFKNYQSVCAEGLAHLKAQKKTALINGQNLQHGNSTLFLLFFCWLRFCKTEKLTCRFDQMPKFVHSMAKLYDLEQLLPL
jgi:ABC-type transporter Mla MlaB component